MNFADRMKKVRATLGVSQPQMADKLGIKLKRLQNIEGGLIKKLNTEEIKSLKNIGVSLLWIQDGSGEMYTQDPTPVDIPDLDLIAEIIEYLEEFLNKNDKFIKPKIKGLLVKEIFLYLKKYSGEEKVVNIKDYMNDHIKSMVKISEAGSA